MYSPNIFFARIAQKRSRMVNSRHEKIPALVPLAVVARYFKIGTDEPHGGDPTKTYDDSRTDKPYLLAQKAYAGILLSR